VIFIEFLFVFDGFDAEEDAAQKQSEDKEEGNKLFLSHLSGPHGHRHGQAAADEHDGIESAEFQIQSAAGFGEHRRVRVAVDGVGKEEAAEEQDFGGQKDPHAERGGILLLLERLKLPR